ncbi:hypothetical protein K7X08_025098 [Anisodus acutangulus]|uniref:Uncharacterized protein n=1 Tax=Anisodus acutangulus TaxID=402998 RepID=A0A9Q1RFN6_9SOLA|nr:hypothetical protein K7X08_025098 [Anisodus acutangulus]
METPSQIRDLHSRNSSLPAEIETLDASNQSLQSKLTEKDELIHQIQLQKDDVHKQYVDLLEINKEVSKERDTLRLTIQRLEDDFYKETERIRTELEVSRKKTEELLDEKREQSEVCSDNLDILQLAKHGLLRAEAGEFCGGKMGRYEKMRKKEKREMENSVVSLEEENRYIISLLKIALVEKETAEKSLNRLRGNSEQKKAVILQIAERGLQKVGFGFGFMMGSAKSETSSDHLDSDTNVKSDNDECQTEAATLAIKKECLCTRAHTHICSRLC